MPRIGARSQPVRNTEKEGIDRERKTEWEETVNFFVLQVA
jgi:hypothetical protein